MILVARDHARVNVAIWGDPDFRNLPPAAQHLYLLLWTSPDLSYVGVADWRPGRLAALAAGWTREHIETAGACLAARHFIVIDPDTEEVLLRSWLRYDGLMKQPRMAISAINAYSSVYSELLRSVIVSEFHRIRKELPGASCWEDKRVVEVLSHPSVEPKSWPTPTDPFTHGLTPDVTPSLGVGLPQTQGDVCLPPTPAPAPATTPAPYSSSPAKRGERGTRVPEDFTITAKMREWANKEIPGFNIDTETPQFIDYWKGVSGNKGVKLDWVATWRNWMRNSFKRQSERKQSGYRSQNDIMRDMQAQAAQQPEPFRLIEGGSP